MYQMDQYTVSLLHFEDGLRDESGKVWTANGGANISTAQSKFGGSSLCCSNRDTQWIETPAHVDFNVGDDDFTVECWIKVPSSENDRNILGQGTFKSGSDYHYGITLAISSTGKLRSSVGSTANSLLFDIFSETIITDNVWHHIAVMRSENKAYLSVDGKIEALTSVTGRVYADDSPFRIMKSNNVNNGSNGYYDEFRFSKGIARWTQNFTPPTEPIQPVISAPTNLTATAGDSKVTLSWTAATGATGYNVKRSTTASGPYSTVGTNVLGTTYVDLTAVNGTTYYYVVTALTANGESGNSNEASATPKAGSVTPPTPVVSTLLRVTMIDSSEREYQLSTAEIDGFINWFNHYTVTDTKSYMLNKAFGKEYLAFDNIISFEVISVTN